MQVSSTAGATSNVSVRLNEAVRAGVAELDQERLSQLDKVQQTIDELSQLGLLKRQKYTAASAADFRGMFVR
jgi:hypothetical protein